jgi:hypothetical protein
MNQDGARANRYCLYECHQSSCRAAGRRERPNPASQQPPSVHEGYLALDSWWNHVRHVQRQNRQDIEWHGTLYAD